MPPKKTKKQNDKSVSRKKSDNKKEVLTPRQEGKSNPSPFSSFKDLVHIQDSAGLFSIVSAKEDAKCAHCRGEFFSVRDLVPPDYRTPLCLMYATEDTTSALKRWDEKNPVLGERGVFFALGFELCMTKEDHRLKERARHGKKLEKSIPNYVHFDCFGVWKEQQWYVKKLPPLLHLQGACEHVDFENRTALQQAECADESNDYLDRGWSSLLEKSQRPFLSGVRFVYPSKPKREINYGGGAGGSSLEAAASSSAAPPDVVLGPCIDYTVAGFQRLPGYVAPFSPTARRIMGSEIAPNKSAGYPLVNAGEHSGKCGAFIKMWNALRQGKSVPDSIKGVLGDSGGAPASAGAAASSSRPAALGITPAQYTEFTKKRRALVEEDTTKEDLQSMLKHNGIGGFQSSGKSRLIEVVAINQTLGVLEACMKCSPLNGKHGGGISGSGWRGQLDFNWSTGEASCRSPGCDGVKDTAQLNRRPWKEGMAPMKRRSKAPTQVGAGVADSDSDSVRLGGKGSMGGGGAG